MKQLKFFTHDAHALDRARSALEQQGFDQSHLKVFCRDNSKRRYDGLLIQSENNSQTERLSSGIFYYGLIFIIGAAAIANQWIDFTLFAGVIFLSHIVQSLFSFLKKKPVLQDRLVKKVYFLVVDVDNHSEKHVSRIVRKNPMLIAQ